MFEQITTLQGLPTDYIYATVEDSDGYMWIGTNKGLYRFNGKIWQQWNIDNALPGNYITNIVPDKKTGLWLQIAEKGIFYFDTKKMKTTATAFTTNAKMLNSNNATGITIQNQQQIHNAIYDKNNISTKQLNTLTNSDFYLQNNNATIGQIAKTNKLQLPKETINFAANNYIGNQQNIYFINKNECKKVNIEPVFTKQLNDVFVTQNDEFCLVANKGEGFVQLDTFGNQTHYSLKQGLNNVDINHIYIAKDGAIYISTLGGGINILKNNERISFAIQNGPVIGIHTNNINYFAIDKSNLYQFGNSFESTIKQALPFTPTSIYCTANNIYIGSQLGVYKYQVNGNIISLHSQINSVSAVNSITECNNQIYCATAGNGLFTLQNNKLITVSAQLPFNTIEKIFSFNNLLYGVSNEQGFFALQNNKVIHFTTKNNLLSNTITSIFVENDTTWIGGKGGVSKMVQNKVVQNFTTANGFKGNTVLNLGINEHQLFVIATEKYLLQLQNNKITPLANIAYEQNSANKISTIYIDNKDDNFVLGNYQNIVVVNMTDFQPNTTITNPQIFKIIVDGKEQNINSNLSLPFNFKNITFNIAPFTNLLFNKNELYYKINNEDWQTINDTLTISFTKLRPGKYKLYLKSINASGIESDILLANSFTVNKPWWLQTWFIVCASLLGVGIVYSITKWFANQKLKKKLQEIETQQKIHDERQRISRDLHDNIGSYTSALLENVQTVKRNNGITETTNQMQTNAEQILSSLRETIWVLHNKEITIIDLNDKFKNYVFKLLRNFENLEFEATENIMENKVLQSAKAIHINSILQEIIQNIIKHSKANKITYLIESNNHQATFTINDNGIGFDTNKILKGNGLDNMEWRAKSEGMQLSYESELNIGTKIIVQLHF